MSGIVTLTFRCDADEECSGSVVETMPIRLAPNATTGSVGAWNRRRTSPVGARFWIAAT